MVICDSNSRRHGTHSYLLDELMKKWMIEQDLKSLYGMVPVISLGLFEDWVPRIDPTPPTLGAESRGTLPLSSVSPSAHTLRALVCLIKGSCLVLAWCSHSLVPKSCLTPWNLMGCSPPGSSVHGILQSRILEWVAISSSTSCRVSHTLRCWTGYSPAPNHVSFDLVLCLQSCACLFLWG